jgi:ribonucleoside-triphosphate reductase (thioredoxin)
MSPPSQYIVKRDGTVQTFDRSKIAAAIAKALQSCDGPDSVKDADVATEEVLAHLPDQCTVENVQDAAEIALMRLGHYDAAKAYILYRQQHTDKRVAQGGFLPKQRSVAKDPPWGPLGYVTYKRTYSRRLETDPTHTEEYHDSVMRVLKSCQQQLHVGFTQEEVDHAYEYLMSLKCSVAGRFLWQLGAPTVDRLGLASLQNCAFVCITDPIKHFAWVFDFLMLGTGVGFSVQAKHVCRIPAVVDADVFVQRKDAADADFIIPDSREGWVAFLEKVMEAYFVRGKSFTFSTHCVRSAGSPIKGFGGVANGPEELVKGVSQICKILRSRRGKQLTSVDVLDVVCIIGQIVVSGNVRRSALICLGDPWDRAYLKAKNWASGNVPNWRAMSNNSVVCASVDELPEDFFQPLIDGSGEPYGLVNIDLCRRVGRLQDGEKYPDPDVEGVNPCSEQPLAPFETCCLAEVFLPNVTSPNELDDICRTLYRICKHSLRLPCHHPDTQAIVWKNARMGIGVTGYLQASEEQRSWLSPAYERLREYDASYSRAHGWPASVKLTTVKPSGTLSLLAGVTPGWHPSLFKHYVRRIRIASNNPLIDVARAHGYHTEYQINFDGTPDHKTTVVSFPCKTPDGCPIAEDMTAIDELEIIRRLQREWSDNAVSATVYVDKSEVPGIKEWLRGHFGEEVKAVSFLLKIGHGFRQAPYEAITAEEYADMVAKTKPITSQIADAVDDIALGEGECAGGACPVR